MHVVAQHALARTKLCKKLYCASPVQKKAAEQCLSASFVFVWQICEWQREKATFNVCNVVIRTCTCILHHIIHIILIYPFFFPLFFQLLFFCLHEFCIVHSTANWPSTPLQMMYYVCVFAGKKLCINLCVLSK